MSRRSAVAIRHVVFEDLGLLAPILARSGWTVSYVEAPIGDLSSPDIERADLLIVLGGPIGVYETMSYPFLSREIALIERRLAKGQPTLGICLAASSWPRRSVRACFRGRRRRSVGGPQAYR